MTKQLNISIFENYSNIIAIQEVTLTIEQFYKSLSDYIIKTKTQNYKNLSIEDIKGKKILGMVPVLFDNKRRHADSMSISKRCMITIDIDSFEGTLDELKAELHNRFSELCYITYTTGKSSEEKPRVRLIFFLKNDFSVTTKEQHSLYKKKIQGFLELCFGYSIVVRDKKTDENGDFILNDKKTKNIYDGKFEIDDASTQANRLMLLPFFYDSEPFLYMNEGELVDLDTIIIQEEKEKVKTFTNKQSRASVSDLSEEDDRNVAELAKLLSNINPSELSYQERLNVGYVIKYEYQGSDEGKEMFANWCLLDSTRTSSIEAIINEAYASYKSMPEHDLITTRRYYVYSLIRRIANAKRKKFDIKVSYKPIPKHLFPDIKIKKDGTIVALGTEDNFAFMLEYYYIDVYLDEISKLEASCLGIQTIRLISLLCSLCTLNDIPDKKVRDMWLPSLCIARPRNLFKNLILSTKWDGVDRMQELCNTITLACEEEDYIKKLDFLDEEEKGLVVERKWLAIKMKHVYVKAWLKQMMYMHMNNDSLDTKKSPRYILCFKGEEQIGKTYWTRTLIPEGLPRSYAKDGITIDGKTDSDLLKPLSLMICELGELVETLKRMGADGFKQFIGCTSDFLNLKFAPRPCDFIRLTSFIATLNDMYFLNNRDAHTRLLTMHVVKMNGYHNIDMRQLYAQVYENEDWQNFELTDDEKEMQKSLNSESVMTDDMQELVTRYFLDAETSRNMKVNRTFYSCVEILNIVGYRDANVKNSANRLAKLLKRMGYYRTSSDKKFLIIQK